ncbi:MAG TPA: hypothetical protein VK826_12490 [Bacteroidia bacterium]|nr:hypothetical protein [Bacteroidia bacterium]
MKKIGNLILPAFIFVLTCSFVLVGGDTTALEGKVYKVTMTLMKNGKAGKPVQAEITFKSGKFRSKLIEKEMGAAAIPVEFIVDSTFFENDEDLPYVEFEGEFVNKLEELVKVTGTVDGYGIEGNVSLSKKDKEKRRYDFVGSLKERKKK